MKDSLIPILNTFFERDLNKLKTEINAYQDESKIWITADGITNCAGNLCLHLVGNLNAFICALYGDTGYVRDREAEFALKDVPRKKLNEMIDQTIIELKQSLNQISTEQLDGDYPLPVTKDKLNTRVFLVHLTTHLTYHLGQINYHRRMLDSASS